MKTFLKQNAKNRATLRKAIAKQTNVKYSHLYILKYRKSDAL